MNDRFKKSRLDSAVFMAAVLFLYAQSCSAPKNKGGKSVAVTANETSKDIYAEHIRTSTFKTPEEEKQLFVLPPGFEVTLFASEPDITKPINMEFDDRGRLWVTQSSEYPVAAGNSDGKDRITILEDKNGDGKAETFTHFDDNLNIPIGIMPVSDGAIAYSIPNLYYFKDDNQDGKADSRKILVGGFGARDTHGMVNNLMRGYDGWLHVCHGFSNTSNIAGTDGDSVKMTSGNTFRMKLDGSHVEQTTFGRVNPFGYAYDERGYLYSVDCHTKPITQLIFGGDYPHFGKKAPAGLGFAPEMMSYELGSTALAGLVYYTGTQFPEQYRNNFYTGDVVTCRIDRTTISYKGSTPVSQKQEPLLVSKDPWFRPVDVKLGPDGSIYIADFYNKIIGHYEVALNHPGRDRLSGRIWKVTYKGDQSRKVIAVTDWSKATLDQLIAGLSHPQINTRLKVADRIVDSWKEKAIDPIKTMLNGTETAQTPYVHALWVLHRLNALDDAILDKVLKESDPVVQVHALRVLLERKSLSPEHFQIVSNALANNDPFVRRTAAEVLSHFPKAENLPLLIELYEKTDPEDSHLRYTALLGVRNNLRDASVMWKVPGMNWSDGQLALLTKAMLDVQSPAAASFVLDFTLTHELPSADLVKNLEYIGRHVSPYQLDKAIDLIQVKFAENPETQLSLYKTIRAGVKQSGVEPGQKLVSWGTSLSTTFLSRISEAQQVAQPSSPITKRFAEKPLSSTDAGFVMAIDIAGDFKIKSLEPKLREILKMNGLDYRVRSGAANALMSIDPKSNVQFLSDAFNNPAESPQLREKLAMSMEQAISPTIFEILKKQLAGGARNLQVAIATVLANSQEGISYLLNAFKDEEVNADVANEIAVQERFAQHANVEQQTQMEKFLAAGSDERAERQKLIDFRIAAFKPSGGLTDSGKIVFIQNCSACHQIQGSGGLVGPQLDGIGNWGHKALTQKILDPNRNITEAFRTYNITLKNDRTLTGLYRRTEGEAMVFADLSGQEFSVAKNEMKEYRASKYTLMPDQFRHIIPEKDFYALLDYLLGIK
ncbi:PVC-type heme-binding CxxCH protein [Dyadobacter sp. CY323]|uniref:PVC-type heme-binding CxxCH protein n=1 Tax=Dyadobacter sp. CY323 TaxID=2907302 RepID=UPI001F2C49FB|nr:PVC-type heme-binding CxxCH protein [Dyadobacter sp. CY323]MCE6988237.1 HEAT repeat domain-containing protein [Dyadobacter sp. CY323]